MKKQVEAKQQAEIAAKQVQLRDLLVTLSDRDKAAVANYFNLYNAAAWLYNEVMSDDARNYADQSAAFARELAMMEAEAVPSDTDNPQEYTDRLNELIDGNN